MKGVGNQVLGFGFQVSGFEFRVKGVGFRVHDSDLAVSFSGFSNFISQKVFITSF